MTRYSTRSSQSGSQGPEQRSSSGEPGEAEPGCVIAIDQGTSSTKASAIDGGGNIRATAQCAISQQHPAPGHVEQDAAEIARSAQTVLDDVAAQLGNDIEVVAVGISSQRESAVMWDRASGEPLGPMLGWQDRRTASAAEQLGQDGVAEEVRARSGLPLDPMFSALKIAWLLDQIDADRRRATNGEIAVGTVDAWLVDQLTGDYRIEAGNASRTQLMNVADVTWDDTLLELFDVPLAALPEIVRSDKPTPPIQSGRLAGVPICGVLGDSHAALYAHGVRAPGAIKATYGTGSSVMGLVDDIAALQAGVVATVAWQTESTAYAGEGNILSTGATLVWLAALLDMEPGQLMDLAATSAGFAPIDLVPAFAGLGAPWWDPAAKATMTGFDLGTSRADLAVAAAESVVLQVEDVIAVFDRSGPRSSRVLVDGGPASNDWLMQRQADLSQRQVIRGAEVGLSALGAAHMAGASIGIFDGDQQLGATGAAVTFDPAADPEIAQQRVARWHSAIDRARFGG